MMKGPACKVVHDDYVFNEIAMFRLFINDSIVDQNVLHSNSYGRSEDASWVDADSVEIRVLIGMLIIAGITKQNMVDIDAMWSDDYEFC